MKIYTRTGDAGETSLFDNSRVSKADPRVDAYGEIDELNACLGVALAAGPGGEIAAALALIQRDLFAVGAQLADPSDRLETGLPPLRRFILAGGSPAGAALHLARTVCRRAERRIVALAPAPDPLVVRYVNRLSDLLFVMARVVNHRDGVPEAEW